MIKVETQGTMAASKYGKSYTTSGTPCEKPEDVFENPYCGVTNAKAAAVDDAVEIFRECHVYSWDMESIKDNHIIVKWEYRNNYTTDYVENTESAKYTYKIPVFW